MPCTLYATVTKPGAPGVPAVLRAALRPCNPNATAWHSRRLPRGTGIIYVFSLLTAVALSRAAVPHGAQMTEGLASPFNDPGDVRFLQPGPARIKWEQFIIGVVECAGVWESLKELMFQCGSTIYLINCTVMTIH